MKKVKLECLDVVIEVPHELEAALLENYGMWCSIIAGNRFILNDIIVPVDRLAETDRTMRKLKHELMYCIKQSEYHFKKGNYDTCKYFNDRFDLVTAKMKDILGDDIYYRSNQS